MLSMKYQNITTNEEQNKNKTNIIKNKIANASLPDNETLRLTF